MKTLIISDTHLKKRFNESRFQKLADLINSVDKVIVNGDLWDDDFISFDDFINSKWSRLFPLLKSKNTIYIFGNHDEEEFTDERVALFSNIQTYVHKIELKDGKVLYITHGHQQVGKFNFIHKIVDKYKFLSRLASYPINFLILIFKERYLKLYQKMNDEMVTWAQANLKPNEILVCGHSHLNQFTPEKQFIDLGHSSLGFFEYLIITDGEMKHYKERM